MSLSVYLYILLFFSKTGNLFINGRNFDIVPATDIEYKRELFLGDGTPHLLIENDFQEMVKRQFLSGINIFLIFYVKNG